MTPYCLGHLGHLPFPVLSTKNGVRTETEGEDLGPTTLLWSLLVSAVRCASPWTGTGCADSQRTSSLIPDLFSATGLQHLCPVARANWNFWISCSPCVGPRLTYSRPLPNLSHSITVTPTWRQMLGICEDRCSYGGRREAQFCLQEAFGNIWRHFWLS